MWETAFYDRTCSAVRLEAFYCSDQNRSPMEQVTWLKRRCEIRNWQGQPVFAQDHVEAPEHWSQLAVDIAASKYFRRLLKPVPGQAYPEGETSVRQLISRVVRAVVQSGQSQGYLRDKVSMGQFQCELEAILLFQRAAFNSPVWFNAGIFEAYQIYGEAEQYYWHPAQNEVLITRSAYEHPQVSACFIQSVADSLMGIFDLLKSEAKVFKFGSGTGTNFSSLRANGEPLENGGTSSGVMSFLEVFDKGAQATKSGGTTRRAAKMVCLDVDHPEIEDFIHWKVREERKARILTKAGYSSEMDGEVYRTVSGQNSNNSVRVTDAFMNAVEQKQPWSLLNRVGNKAAKTLPAQELWQQIVQSAWECADPGLQFHDTIQRWNTCAQSGVIRASNPCSEFMFLDDTACNLASLNLCQFYKEDNTDQMRFDWAALTHVARTLIVAQDILVDYASYPTAQIARNSHQFRPLGLGYTNLGGLLMRLGIRYGSPQAQAWTRLLTAWIHAQALLTSCELAQSFGAFERFAENQSVALRVLEQHAHAWQQCHSQVVQLLPAQTEWCQKLQGVWQQVQHMAQQFGLRNAQVTAIAPTGTISLIMDCDTTGIEPEYALVKSKKLVGGGVVRQVNQSVAHGLHSLGYSSAAQQSVLRHLEQTGFIDGAQGLSREHQSIFSCVQTKNVDSPNALHWRDHLSMMAAAQPFLSGAISKTVNLPRSATSAEVGEVYWAAWRLGLKSIAIYRDQSKVVQPLEVGAEPTSLPCPECGHPTVRSGSCFRCVNCGHETSC